MKQLFSFSLLLTLMVMSCDKENVGEGDKNMNFKFRFNTSQERLNNWGNPVGVPAGNAAQSPDFNSMSVHYIELVPTKTTPIKAGAVVYEGKTQDAQINLPPDLGNQAIVWDQAIKSDENIIFLSVPLNEIPKGTYEYMRVSVTYQNADVRFNIKNVPVLGDLNNQIGTFAGFIGFNTHINQHTVKTKTISVNADKTQGYIAFESLITGIPAPYNEILIERQTSATTVVNPLAQFGVTIPQGSCIVTGALETPLTITGEEKEDVLLTLSFSTNNSFEWQDFNANGQLDFDLKGTTDTADDVHEQVVDMGLRGLKVIVE